MGQWCQKALIKLFAVENKEKKKKKEKWIFQ